MRSKYHWRSQYNSSKANITEKAPSRVLFLVRTTGFEPAASCSQSKRSTKLSHVRISIHFSLFYCRRKRSSCCGTLCAPCRRSGYVACRPFGVPDIFLADKSATSTIDPGTRLCSAVSATGSAEQRGRSHSLRSLAPPQAALPSLYQTEPRPDIYSLFIVLLPAQALFLLRYPISSLPTSGFVSYRPQPLAQVACSATGGAPIAPQTEPRPVIYSLPPLYTKKRKKQWKNGRTLRKLNVSPKTLKILTIFPGLL